METNKNNSAMATAALPLGIISIVLCAFWYITIPTGVLAVIFGSKTTRKYASKLGKSGMITGIVGLSLCAFIYMTMALRLIAY